MSDLIDRQAAIDVLNAGAEFLRRVLDDADIVSAGRAKYKLGFDDLLDLIEDYITDIKELPSAQPEQPIIVRCKDCKWYELPSHKITENCVRWMKSNSILLPIKPNDYCSYAERKEGEADG